jgi:hypothetical protein
MLNPTPSIARAAPSASPSWSYHTPSCRACLAPAVAALRRPRSLVRVTPDEVSRCRSETYHLCKVTIPGPDTMAPQAKIKNYAGRESLAIVDATSMTEVESF